MLHSQPAEALSEEISHMAEELIGVRSVSGHKTLLDEFAMAALVNCSGHIGCPKEMAAAAYEIGRAMMKERAPH